MAGSSLYAYLSHYFFIIIIAVMIVRPYKITFIPALVLEIILTNLAILITYTIFDTVYNLLMPAKKNVKKEENQEEQRALLKEKEIEARNR
jgi:hypothetical protein